MFTSKCVSDFKANVKEAITLEITSEDDLLKSKCLFLSWHAGCGSEQWYIKKMQTNFYFSLIKEDIQCKHQKNLKQKRAEVQHEWVVYFKVLYTAHKRSTRYYKKLIDTAHGDNFLFATRNRRRIPKSVLQYLFPSTFIGIEIWAIQVEAL
jgi:hypothetical protein